MSRTVLMLADSSSDGDAAIFVLLLAGSLIFAWIVGIAEIAGKPENEFATGTRTTWLLLVIFTGIFGLIAYVAVGKKRDAMAAPRAQAKFHDVRWSNSSGTWTWTCFEPGCGLTFERQRDANLHRKLTGTGYAPSPRPTRTKTAYPGTAPPAPPAPVVTAPAPESTPLTAAESKTCPDCAEEIRAAARKCRFCGYMFESAEASS